MSKLVLVADDEKDIVEIACELLEDAGYRTLSAYDGQEALQAIQRDRPDAIVLDIKMPVMDGFQVIEHLRANPELSAIPIVVLTATQVIQEAQERFRQLGVTYWISKPFEPKDLVSAVTQALSEG